MLTNNKRQNQKKQAEVSDSEEDRLSKLPEGIITQILSFLSTKESVRTSILSTRWKYIWSSVPTLDLAYSDFKSKAHSRDVNFQERNAIDNFLNVVDGLLMGRQSQHVLDKVHIDGSSSGTHDGSRINAWICAVIKRNVRKLHLLGLDSTKPRELHQSLHSSNTLVVLKLDVNVILNFPMTSTCFPNLKVLELERSVTFKDGTSAQNLISSCPILEDLFISRYDSHNLRTFNLTSRSLKKLVLRYRDAGYYNGSDEIIVIDVPALETLDIEDDTGTHEYVVRDLSSIINAKLDVSNEFCEDPISYGTCLFELLIKRIFNVKFLQLSERTMFSLSHWNSYNLPTFRNLTYLEFFACYYSCELKLVIEFLKNSPILEVLIFEGFNFPHEEQGTTLESYVVPKCFTSHLKTVKISGSIHEGKEVVRYFLKNAKVLKNLTIETDCYEHLKKLKIDCEDIFMHQRGSMTWSDGKLVISFV